MCTRSLLFRAIIPFALCAVPMPAFGQVAPADNLELVRTQPTVVSSVEERREMLNLLEQAQRNYRPAMGGHPFAMRATFTSTGQTAYEGDGTFEETVSGPRWRMTAQIAGATFIRLGQHTRIYGNSGTAPFPLRLQLIWRALFYPVNVAAAPNNMLRVAQVNFKGDALTCILKSGSVPAEVPARFYQEEEACVNPETHLLRVWSAKPGIYAEYDYTNAIDFHGSILARQITITVAGSPLVVIRIDSVRDATEADEAGLNLTPELVESFAVGNQDAFPLRVPAPFGYSSNSRVIVHASIGANDGNVIEAELIQASNPGLTQAALEAVKSQHFQPTGIQREAFINVMFNLTPER